MVRERLGLWERGRAHEGFTDTEADLGEPGSPGPPFVGKICLSLKGAPLIKNS